MPRSESWDISLPLAALMALKGWNQATLAEKAGLQRTDVTAMLRTDESQGEVLKVGRLRGKRIADALGVTPVDLGLPPEEAERSVPSTAHRLARLEASLERVLQALDLAGIEIPAVEAASLSAPSAPRSRQRKAR